MRSICFFASCFLFASSAQASAQAHYEPLAESSDWSLEDPGGGPALQDAIARTGWPDAVPLLDGWISPWVYMRLYDDRQIYFVLVDEDAADEKYVCRVSFGSFPPSNANRDAEAVVARLGALCEHERTESLGAADMRAISPGQPGGPKPGAELEYSLADGTGLIIQHIENSGIWLPALPPELSKAPLVIGNMPTARGTSASRHERYWYVREETGEWGVSVHFGHGLDLGRSGCFIRNPSAPKRPPSAEWLSSAALDWCREKQAAYVEQYPAKPAVRALALPPRPTPPPGD